MTIAWLLASILTSALIGTAALCIERVLMLRRGLPLRWVWITAIALSLAWSARGLLPAPAPLATPSPQVTALVVADPMVAPNVTQRALVLPESTVPSTTATPWSLPDWTRLPWPVVSARTEQVVRVLWGATAAALLLAMAWSALRLRREKRQWRPMSLVGTDVLVSNGFGPAIVGLWRPVIVVPSWVLEVDVRTQRTILLHEDEHRRAGDQWLLLWSFVAVVLAPWNMVLWVMGRRLARTIELDCDERVLAHGVADVEYANVLLNAWQRTRHVVPWVPSPALAEHVSRLGRRVEHLMRPSPRRRAMKTIGGVGVSAVLLGVAVLVPRPHQAQERAVVVTAAPAKVPVPETVARATAAPSQTAPSQTAPLRATAAAAAARPASSPPAAATATRPASDKTPPITVTAQTASQAPLQRARIAVIMPFDSVGMPIAELVHRYLQSDAAQYAVSMISPKEIKSYLSASGFATTASLSPSDVRALGSLLRADLIVSATLDGGSEAVTVNASIGSPREASLRSLRKGSGSALYVAELLVEGIRSDSAYIRMRRPLSSLPAVAFRPAVFRPGSSGPAYPTDLREAGVSGDVVARFVVDTTNRVDESTIAILASDRPQFAVAVIESLRSTRFLAADRDGVKVRQTMQVAYQFDRKGGMTAVRIVTDDAAIRDIRQRFDARASRH
jgi:TonB family protein